MPKSSLFGMPARYLATPPTLTDGDAVPLLVDENGALIITGGGAGAVTSVNGQDGTVVLDAEDVNALPDDFIPEATADGQILYASGGEWITLAPPVAPGTHTLKIDAGSIAWVLDT